MGLIIEPCCNEYSRQKQTQLLFQSYKDMQQQLKQYSQSNNLSQYCYFDRKLIEQLFTLGQNHLSDLIIHLHQLNKQQQLRKLQLQLNSFHLETYDYVYHLIRSKRQSIPKSFNHNNNNNHNNNISNNNNNNNISKQLISCTNLRLQGKKSIENNQVLIMVPIQCFQGIGCLNKQQNLLELFLKKLDKYSKSYHFNNNNPIKIILLVNEIYYKIVQQKWKIYCLQYSKNLSIEIIKYKSTIPMFNKNGRILISNLNELIFRSENGDLLDFCSHNVKLKQIITHFKYIYYCNIYFTDDFVQELLLGFLQYNKNITIIAKVVPNIHTYIDINSPFLTELPQDNKYKHKGYANLSFCGIYLLRTDLLLASLPISKYYDVLQPQINIINIQQFQYTFSRTFKNILFNQFTMLKKTGNFKLKISKKVSIIHDKAFDFTQQQSLNYEKK